MKKYKPKQIVKKKIKKEKKSPKTSEVKFMSRKEYDKEVDRLNNEIEKILKNAIGGSIYQDSKALDEQFELSLQRDELVRKYQAREKQLQRESNQEES